MLATMDSAIKDTQAKAEQERERERERKIGRENREILKGSKGKNNIIKL